MYKEIAGLAIRGRAFTEETKLNFFPNQNDRISIVYGRNGSGKSTLAEGFASCCENLGTSDLHTKLIKSDGSFIPRINKDNSNLFVFNESFVDNNVKIDGDGLGTIVLLGGKVDVDKEIQSVQAKLDDAIQDMQKIESDISDHSEIANVLSPKYHWNKIKNSLKQDGGWAETNSKLKGNTQKSAVTDAIIEEIGKLSSKMTLQELKAEFNSKSELLSKVSDDALRFPDPITLITISSSFDEQLVSLINEIIERPVLTARETAILETIENGLQAQVESARYIFSKDDTLSCPFCYQPIDKEYKETLVESINSVLNKDVENYKNALSEIRFPIIQFDPEVYAVINAELVSKIIPAIKNCNEVIKKYQDIVQNKSDNVFKQLSIESLNLGLGINSLNFLLGELDKSRISFNLAVQQRNDLKEELLVLNKLIAKKSLESDYAALYKQQKAHNALLGAQEQKKKNIQAFEMQIEQLNQKKTDVGIAIQSINNALKYIFFSDKSLSIELKDDLYYLKSSDIYVKPKDVSCGERNIIALCYFFTQIMRNQNISELYKQEKFVVIDDPISSFDFENKVGMMSYLKNQIQRIILGNNNSKVIVMSHDLTTIFDLRKAVEEICVATKGVAQIDDTNFASLQILDKSFVPFYKTRSEYTTLIGSIYSYALDKSGLDSFSIGNAMRRMVEAFSTFVYRKPIEKLSCSREVLKSLGNRSIYFESLMYRLVLHGESHFEEQVQSLHDANNFYNFISDDEKQATAKNVLCMISLLNPAHLNAHLMEIKGAQADIKLWCKDIPLNTDFEIAESTDSSQVAEFDENLLAFRKIPLYDLKISAGHGIISLEDIPREDYETKNQACSFALKVSGDSMEPEIQDGDIILVKQCDTMPDGKTGVFYYDDNMFCKKLGHVGEKTILISENKEYEPKEIEYEDRFRFYGEVVEIVK